MGLDASIRRWFPAIVCLFLMTAAYLQASGVSSLLASTVVSTTPPHARAPSLPSPLPRSEHDTSAAAIISRNPFDSITGSLDGKPDGDPVQPTSPGPGADPYEDPACDAGRALVIAASEDPTWSFAAIAGPDGKALLRRRGDELDGKTVYFIGDLREPERKSADRRGLWDRVWLTSGNTRCQLALGAPAPAPVAAAPKPATGQLPPGVRKLAEGSFEIERQALDALLANPAELMKARLTPDKEGDRVVGMRISGLRKGSPLAALGVENGDRLSRINDFDLGDPKTALEAYNKLQRADHLSLSIVRKGKPMSIDYAVR